MSDPTIEITFENSTTDARVAQIIQQMASEAGFTVNLLPLETSSAIERYLNGNFELYIGNWSGRSDPDPTLTTFFGSEGSQNLNGYRSEEMDAALEEGRSSLEPEARKAAYDKVAEIYLSDLPTIPLYHPTWFYGAQADIDGHRDLSRRHPARHRGQAGRRTDRRGRPRRPSRGRRATPVANATDSPCSA